MLVAISPTCHKYDDRMEMCITVENGWVVRVILLSETSPLPSPRRLQPPRMKLSVRRAQFNIINNTSAAPRNVRAALARRSSARASACRLCDEAIHFFFLLSYSALHCVRRSAVGWGYVCASGYRKYTIIPFR